MWSHTVCAVSAAFPPLPILGLFFFTFYFSVISDILRSCKFHMLFAQFPTVNILPQSLPHFLCVFFLFFFLNHLRVVYRHNVPFS